MTLTRMAPYSYIGLTGLACMEHLTRRELLEIWIVDFKTGLANILMPVRQSRDVVAASADLTSLLW